MRKSGSAVDLKSTEQNLTFTQGVNMASSALVAGINTYTEYNRAKHNERMAEMNYAHNKAMVLENLKLNQYIVSRNKIDILSASADEKMALETRAMEAKAEATVAHATYGMQGGSAMQVLHSISREAEKAESQRLAQLDAALFGNKLQLYRGESGAVQATGIRPVGGVSGNLAVGSAVANISANFKNITSS